MSRHLVNELINLPRTGVQFGAPHLAKICTCSSLNCNLSQFIGAVRQTAQTNFRYVQCAELHLSLTVK